MSKAVLIEKGGDLIALVKEALLEAGGDPSRSLVIFPGRRPGHFLRKALAEFHGRASLAPHFHAMDDWIDLAHRALGFQQRPLEKMDAVALLFRVHKKRGMPGESKTLALDEFLPWGYKLFSDFEDLKIEGVEPEALRRMQVIAEERLPRRIQSTLSGLADLYAEFYDELQRKNCSTRSTRYRNVAEECGRMDLSRYDRIILAGFFALTGAEKRILSEMLSHEKTTLFVQDGPGIRRLLDSLAVDFEDARSAVGRPGISYYWAPNCHGQVMKLEEIISRKRGARDQVVVLPEPGTLFPLVQHTLPALDMEWNISMGFPLHRTPVYSMLSSLNRALETAHEGRYFVPDYLRLVLQPYIKNLFLDRASYPTRILFHTIEETLTRSHSRFVGLDEIEENDELMADVLDRLARAGSKKPDAKRVAGHLRRIHDVLLRAFEKPGTIGEFSEHVLDVITMISLDSPADLHPYTSKFIKSLIEALARLRMSDIASEPLPNPRACFAVLDTYVRSMTVPFQGTPLKPFQILGFLETRSLCFKTVYILDMNEDVIPRSRKEDTLLPAQVRAELGLSTYRAQEEIASYYFENLIAAAEDVHILYRQDKDRERSRLVERLVWEEQKRQSNLELVRPGTVFFESFFGQKDPQPVRKDEACLKKLQTISFSATTLARYLKCPISFYYRYVLGLEEKESVSDRLEPMDVGNLVHRILSMYFETKKERPLRISEDDYKAVLEISDQVFREEFSSEVSGSSYLTKSQIDLRLKDILDYHLRAHTGISIVDCERSYSARIDVPEVGQVRLKGKMDRIHRTKKETVIIDYKTGGGSANIGLRKFSPVERSEWHKTLDPIQLPFYLLLYLSESPSSKIETLNSGLMLLGPKAIEECYLFQDGDDRRSAYGEYEEAIHSLIREILDPDSMFTEAPDPGASCAYCPFRVTCGRQWVRVRW